MKDRNFYRVIETCGCEVVGLRVPLVEISKDSFDHIDIVDESSRTARTVGVVAVVVHQVFIAVEFTAPGFLL